MKVLESFFNETTVGNVVINFTAEGSGRFSPMAQTLTKKKQSPITESSSKMIAS